MPKNKDMSEKDNFIEVNNEDDLLELSNNQDLK